MVRLTIVAAAAVSLVSLGSALAAEPAKTKADRGSPPAASKPVPASGPRSTTAAYGDWVVTCVAAEIDGKPKSTCAMTQRLRRSKDGGDLALYRLSLGKTETDLHLAVIVPANVSLVEAARLERDGDKDKAEALGWRTCAVGGCIAEADTTTARWRALVDEPGRTVRLTFRNAAGQPVALPLSLEGIKPALAALSQTRSAP